MLLAKSKQPHQWDPGLLSQTCWTSLIHWTNKEENASESWFGSIDWMSIQQCHSVAKGLLNWRNILLLELDRLTTRHTKGYCLEDMLQIQRSGRVQSTLTLWAPYHNGLPDNMDSSYIPGKKKYRNLTEMNSSYYRLLLIGTLTQGPWSVR